MITQQVNTAHGIAQVKVFEDTDDSYITYCESERKMDCILVAFVYQASVMIGAIHSHGEAHELWAFHNVVKDYEKVYIGREDVGQEFGPFSSIEQAASALTERLFAFQEHEKAVAASDRADFTEKPLEQQIAEILRK